MSIRSDIDIIERNPIGDGLDEFRRELEATFNAIGICDFPNSQESVVQFEESSSNRIPHTVVLY
jgi:hypothetical protein